MSLGSKIEDQLMELERAYWSAIQDQDARTAASLSDDPCVIVGARGVAEIDERTLTGMLESASYNLKSFAFRDVHVRPLTDDVVLVAYKVEEDLEVDGEELRLEAFDSSVWVRRGGRWVCALHTESIAGDPFGRPASRRQASVVARDESLAPTV